MSQSRVLRCRTRYSCQRRFPPQARFPLGHRCSGRRSRRPSSPVAPMQFWSTRRSPSSRPNGLGDWIDRSGKRLTYIYVTHGHGDHWFGVSLLAVGFPGLLVYATEGTIRLMPAEYLHTARQVIAEKPTAREFFDVMTRRYRTGSTPAPSGSMRNGWRER
jgi:hypothetical protein